MLYSFSAMAYFTQHTCSSVPFLCAYRTPSTVCAYVYENFALFYYILFSMCACMQYKRKSEASLWESVLMWVPMLELRLCSPSAVIFQICSIPESTHSLLL